ncbi:hypothetical protein [Shimia sediminis]|uniref:hypothetical protein n=1 Tax=Shimia sediminis TaxID=2497945 RepID=UPI000F8D5C7D|nr:hypothetical protein [Shimia sediminis]
MVNDLANRGWIRFPYDPEVEAWSRATNHLAEAAMADPALAHWWVCEDTWFVGVDALDNDAHGHLPDGTPLPDGLMAPLHDSFGRYPLHKAQVSVIRPGYPRPRETESAAGYRYRLKRDAAHVDGLKPEGPDRQRMVKEPHAYILGLPLNDTAPEAAPLVIWEGSHEIIRRALQRAFAPHPPDTWDCVDVTGIYQAARREVFDTCKRVTLHARPGEAYLLHRLSLHGVAPWAGPDQGDRRIAYFRPDMGSVQKWLEMP